MYSYSVKKCRTYTSRSVSSKGNVREFNTHVDTVRIVLEGRVQQSDELHMHFFRANEALPDSNFLRFIQNKRDDYEREDNANDISIIVPMLLACNKFDLLNHRSTLPGENSDCIVLSSGDSKASTNTDGRGRSVPSPFVPCHKVGTYCDAPTRRRSVPILGRRERRPTTSITWPADIILLLLALYS
jgi:hypothetical protein